MSITNRRLVDFDGADFYCTPSWGTEALMDIEIFEGTVLEPCCGDGAMAEVIARWNEVQASDKFARGYGEVKDVFDYQDQYDNVITNPPFSISDDLVKHFIPRTRHKLAILQRLAYLEGSERWRDIYRETPPRRVMVFSERLSMYPSGQKGNRGSGTTAYAWFVWDFKDLSKSTELFWIEPGRKPGSRFKIV